MYNDSIITCRYPKWNSRFFSTNTFPIGWLWPRGAENRERWDMDACTSVIMSSSSTQRSLWDWFSIILVFLQKEGDIILSKYVIQSQLLSNYCIYMYLLSFLLKVFASHRFLLLFLVTSSSSVWGSWTSPFGRSCCSLSSFKTMKSRTIHLKRSNIHKWNVNIININYLPKWCAFFFFFFFCGGLSWGSGVSGSLRLSRPSISIAGSGPAVVYWVLYKYKGDQFLYLKEKKQLQNMCSKQ